MYIPNKPPNFTIAPRLSAFQRNLISNMIEAGDFSNREIATAAHTTDRSIRSIQRNIRVFGQESAPINRPGRPATLTQVMVEALLDYLSNKPELYLEEMAWFIWDEFKVVISTSALSRALDKAGWSKKQVR
jgi:transposase